LLLLLLNFLETKATPSDKQTTAPAQQPQPHAAICTHMYVRVAMCALLLHYLSICRCYPPFYIIPARNRPCFVLAPPLFVVCNEFAASGMFGLVWFSCALPHGAGPPPTHQRQPLATYATGSSRKQNLSSTDKARSPAAPKQAISAPPRREEERQRRGLTAPYYPGSTKAHPSDQGVQWGASSSVPRRWPPTTPCACRAAAPATRGRPAGAPAVRAEITRGQAPHRNFGDGGRCFWLLSRGRGRLCE
jgi:hypothetical protein